MFETIQNFEMIEVEWAFSLNLVPLQAIQTEEVKRLN